MNTKTIRAHRWTLPTVLALVGTVFWLYLFSAGLLVDSGPFRQGNTAFLSLSLAAVFFTPTNLAMLTMMSAFLGGCASRFRDVEKLQVMSREALAVGRVQLARTLERRARYLGESPIVSMLRGLLVYLGMISGLLLAISSPFETPTQGEFIRLAGLFSAIAFVTGYDPTVFEALLARVARGSPEPPGRGAADLGPISQPRPPVEVMIGPHRDADKRTT